MPPEGAAKSATPPVHQELPVASVQTASSPFELVFQTLVAEAGSPAAACHDAPSHAAYWRAPPSVQLATARPPGDAQTAG